MSSSTGVTHVTELTVVGTSKKSTHFSYRIVMVVYIPVDEDNFSFTSFLEL